jgi:hypothetical protein
MSYCQIIFNIEKKQRQKNNIFINYSGDMKVYEALVSDRQSKAEFHIPVAWHYNFKSTQEVNQYNKNEIIRYFNLQFTANVDELSYQEYKSKLKHIMILKEEELLKEKKREELQSLNTYYGRK